ncbi:hypothetical protein RV03_GL003080 [Enterococcus gallinarum]|nr:hypothetical protein RV03_GL003080 [Enterococcus gallinarum]
MLWGKRKKFNAIQIHNTPNEINPIRLIVIHRFLSVFPSIDLPDIAAILTKKAAERRVKFFMSL